MCGICGLVPMRRNAVPPHHRDRVSAMVTALAHRGPDASGLSDGDAAVLGATRLAIRGLKSGRQPIIDSASGVVAVCNGEIDNHAELRQWLAARNRLVADESDIAIIPQLYLELGEAFVERLQGVFAIAIWDPRENLVLLARDRAGERPLFYSHTDGTVRFATELAALAGDHESSREISPEAISEFLRIGCVVAPKSPFRGIEKVSPGEIVIIRGEQIVKRRYWRWNICASAKRPANVESFDEVFRAAVSRQTDVDVPFGVFLSGGLDSSLAAAVLRDLRPNTPIKAYSLRFREASYDEGVFAEAVAERLDLELHQTWVEAESFPGTIRKLLRQVGEPLADPAWVPTALLAERAARDVKLVIGGEGGDELFGGYPTYVAAWVGEGFLKLPGWMRGALRMVVNAWPESDQKVTVSYLLKRFVQNVDSPPLRRHFEWKANASRETLQMLGVHGRLPPLFADVADADILDTLQRADLETTLAEGLLTKADRAGMASAVEIRSPFLDHHVLEFAASLPASERVRGFETKRFLKRYALNYLPREIVHRRKRGLSVPLSSWLRGPLAAWAKKRLWESELYRFGIFPSVVSGLLEEHQSRRCDHARLLWALIVLAEWLDWVKELQSHPACNDRTVGI